MSSFYTSVPKIMIIWYIVPEIWHVTDVIVIFHFGLFFALSPPWLARKMKISKKFLKSLEISFYTCVPKIMIRWCTVPKKWCATDGRMDGRMEKVTHAGGCPTYKITQKVPFSFAKGTWNRPLVKLPWLLISLRTFIRTELADFSRLNYDYQIEQPTLLAVNTHLNLNMSSFSCLF